MEVSNYIFKNSFSRIKYESKRGLHLFFFTGKVFLKIKVPKKGLLFFKNIDKLNKVTYLSLTSNGFKRYSCKLNPDELKEFNGKSLELSPSKKFNHTLLYSNFYSFNKAKISFMEKSINRRLDFKTYLNSIFLKNIYKKLTFKTYQNGN
ncbi:MAG: hypothetical protein HN595_00145 [Flavobacteriaceae bacterium]|jgi:hypothetical protein|nr:hypothetical protein [Flavobacteriaceae bacterium]